MKQNFPNFRLVFASFAIAFALFAPLASSAAQDPSPGATGNNGGGASPPANSPPNDDQLFFSDPDIQSVASPESLLRTGDDKNKLEQLAENCTLGDQADSTLAGFLVDRAQDRFAGSAELLRSDFVAFVHIAAFKDGTAPVGDCWYKVGKYKFLSAGGKQVASSSSGVRWSVQVGSAPRLYGAKDVGVLFFHLDDKNASSFAAISGNVVYKGVVKKKLPANLQNLLSLIRLPTVMADEHGISYWGHGIVNSVSATSDITVMAVGVQGKAKRIGNKITADNEGKHFWDASVLVPVSKLSGLSYSGTPAQFAPKQINVQTIYAAFDLYVSTFWNHPIDLKAGKESLCMPRLVFGTGVTGHPGDRFLLGGSPGCPQLQGFVGIAYGRVDRLNPTAAPGGSGAVVQQFYHSNLAFGVNIPVAQAA